jgi:hypothetical protein
MLTDVSEVRAASIIALMTEAARISETSVDIQLRTRQYIPEDSEIRTVKCCHGCGGFLLKGVIAIGFSVEASSLSTKKNNSCVTI